MSGIILSTITLTAIVYLSINIKGKSYNLIYGNVFNTLQQNLVCAGGLVYYYFVNNFIA